MPDVAVTHQLKCWPVYFDAVLLGRKNFEVREGNRRIYSVGDVLRLQEWDPARKDYTGREVNRVVTYVMHGAPFLPDSMWVLGMKPISCS
jgi:hypothetical protein